MPQKLQVKFYNEGEVEAVQAASRYLKMTDKQFLRVAALRLIDELVKHVQQEQENKRYAEEVAKAADSGELASGNINSPGTQPPSDVGGSEPAEAELQPKPV